MPSPELLARMEQVRSRFSVVPSLEQRRRASAATTVTPADVCVEAVQAGSVPGEWLSVEGSEPSGVVLYFHAGGYVAGSPAMARAFAADVSRSASVRFLSPAYRLAPEHPFPSAVNDALDAYRWLLKEGLEPDQIVVGGTSAGGGLAIAMLVACSARGLPLPAAAFGVCPWLDMTLSSASMRATHSEDPIPLGELRAAAAHYLAGQDPLSPLASPVFADLSGLPALHLEVGTADRLVDDTRNLAIRAREAGVHITVEETDGAMHSFPHIAAGTPEAVAAIHRVSNHVRSRLRR